MLIRALDAPTLAAIAEAQRASGTPIHLVGGAVRDLLLGRPTIDADLVAEGDGVAVARSLAASLGGRLVVHAPFGTAELHLPGHVLDVASTRRERYETPGALPEVEVGATLADDLRRRDFTVNAMALRLAPDADGVVLDPLGGRADLEAGRLRVLHDASFLDDATRLVRAARYVARLGLALDEPSDALARAAASPETVWSVGGPRLRDALQLLAAEPDAAGAFGVLHELGVLAAVEPAAEGGPEVAARMARLDALRAAHASDEGEAWRARLGLVLQGVPAERLEALLARLEPSGRDRAAIGRRRVGAAAAAGAGLGADRGARAPAGGGGAGARRRRAGARRAVPRHPASRAPGARRRRPAGRAGDPTVARYRSDPADPAQTAAGRRAWRPRRAGGRGAAHARRDAPVSLAAVPGHEPEGQEQHEDDRGRDGGQQDRAGLGRARHR